MEEELSSPPSTPRGRQDSLHLTTTVQSPPPVILVTLQPSVSSVGKKKMRLRLSPFFSSHHEEAVSDGEIDRLSIPRRSRFFRRRKDEQLVMSKPDSVSLTDLDRSAVVRPISTPNPGSFGNKTPSLINKTPGIPFRKHNNDNLDRRVSCTDLGGGDCEGWLMKKREGGSGRSVKKWSEYWFILKNKNLYFFVSREDMKAQGVIYLPGFQISPAPEVKSKKFAFKAHHSGTTFYFASESREEMKKWMNKMGIASLGNLELSNSLTTAGFNKLELFIQHDEDASDSTSRCSSLYSEESDEESISGTSSIQMSPSTSLAGSREDISDLYRNIRRANLDLSGMNVKDKRSSIFTLTTASGSGFSECYLRLTSLQRTLKDKEQALATIDKLLQSGMVMSEMLQNFIHQHSRLLVEHDTDETANDESTTSLRQSNISEADFDNSAVTDKTQDSVLLLHTIEYNNTSQELRVSSHESVKNEAKDQDNIISKKNFDITAESDIAHDSLILERTTEYENSNLELRVSFHESRVVEPEEGKEVSPTSDETPTLEYGMSMIDEGLGSSNRMSIGNALTISFVIDASSKV